MRIGVSRYMQNYPELERESARVPDSAIYDDELAIASLAEPQLRFDLDDQPLLLAVDDR